MEEPVGDITMDFKFAEATEVTFKVAVAWSAPVCAVIVTVPGREPIASPDFAIRAMLEFVELHCAMFVTSLAVPSENWAVTLNCCNTPAPIDAEYGEICMDEMLGAEDGGCDCGPEPKT